MTYGLNHWRTTTTPSFDLNIIGSPKALLTDGNSSFHNKMPLYSPKGQSASVRPIRIVFSLNLWKTAAIPSFKLIITE